MPSKAKVTVSVDRALIRDLNDVSRRSRKPKSHLVEEALRLWQRARLEQALKEGYCALAAENRATARRYLPAVLEALK